MLFNALVHGVTALTLGTVTGPTAADIGLVAEHLVVAGVDAAGASLVVSNLGSDAVTAAWAEHQTADAQWIAATEALIDARTAVIDDPGDTDAQASLNEAETAQRDAADAREAARQHVQDLALAVLGANVQLAADEAEQRDLVTDLPAAMLVLDMTDAELVELAVALKAEARANRTGDDLDANKADLLASVRARSEVIAAEQRLDTSLAAVESALHAAD